MYKFKVNFWDEMEQKMSTEQGLIGGKTYGDAAENVCDYYGRQNVNGIYLEELDTIILDSEMSHVFEENDIDKFRV